MGMRHTAGMGLRKPESRIQHRNSIVASFRAAECEIRTGLLDQNPRVIKNLRVPMQSPGPEKISGPGKGKPPGSEGTSGFPNDPRVLIRPQDPKYDLRILNTTSGSKGTSGFPQDLRV
ncbi:hypothetical protein F2Q70_00003881 [Brassica cretica]|uniref:Uncharacterized protein n=1 Tax=Brassica cretica TaxID=69181 RepID=A0A8S9IW88_BRACR|nr:hypothetical protein F2Q70_00003881 [Brassica cretica]